MTISEHQTAAATFSVCCCDSRRLCYQAQWSVTEMKNGGDSEGKEKPNGGAGKRGGSNCGRKLHRVEIKEKEDEVKRGQRGRE